MARAGRAARRAVLGALLGVAVGGTASAKTLVYCSEGSPENFNSMINTTGTTFDANRPIYQRLVAFAPGTTTVVPSLAERWDVSADGLVYTFHLRQGVAWQPNARFRPTRPFNADDVLFSFDRQGKADSPFHAVSGGGYEYWNDMAFPTLLKSVEKLDDATVRFTLSQPQAPFLADLAMDFAMIQSKEYGDVLLKAGKPELIDQEPVGTGPFALLAYQRDAVIRYRAFPGYWGEKPHVDNLVFSIVRDPAVRLAKLRANECQVMSYPAMADLGAIRADPHLQMMDQPGLNIGYLGLNTTKKPFDDRRVRLAVNLAVDRKAILDAVYQGAGTSATTLLPPTLWAYDAAIGPYPHDPGQARALLAEAGYKDGVDIDLWAMPVQRPYNPDARRAAELMQADLAAVGVRAKIVSLEWGEYRKRVAQGDDQSAEFGWTGDNGDPDNFYMPLTGCAAAAPGGSNTPKWCDRAYDDLIRRAATLSDQGQRKALYDQAAVILHDAAPFFLLAHSTVFMPMRREVSGYVMSPLGSHEFATVDIP